MENENIVTIQFKLTRNKALLLTVLFFLCWHPNILNSETLTLTTYYPAPYGGYVSLLTTGAGGSNTLLARDGGNVLIGEGTQPNPVQKLDVNGSVRTTGEMTGTLGSGFGQFRAVAGNYGAFIRNDGSDTYMPLLTAPGTPYGMWNGFRPLRVNNASGDLYVANGQIVFRQNSGTVEGICTLRNYTFGGASSCLAGERVFGFFGDGNVRMWGWLPGIGAWYGQDQSNVTAGNIVGFGQDWSGTMACCRM